MNAIKQVEQLLAEYKMLRDTHHAQAVELDRKNEYVEYMCERTMEAYCRGCVSAYNAVLVMLQAEANNERK